MGITVKGVNVRTEELKTKFKVSFADLTAEGQRRVFLEQKDEFLYEALTSRYGSVKKVAKKNKGKCSSKTINKVLKHLLSESDRRLKLDLILDILSTPNFEIEQEVVKKLSNSNYSKLRLGVAKDSNTPLQILKDMFSDEAFAIVGYGYSEVFDAIITNPRFELDEEINQKIQAFGPCGISTINARVKKITEKTE